MILDTLAASTRKRVEAAKEKIPLGTMMNLASQASEARQNGAKESVFSFEKALKEPGMSFICEVKMASPSKGLIAPDFDAYSTEQVEYSATSGKTFIIPDVWFGRASELSASGEYEWVCGNTPNGLGDQEPYFSADPQGATLSATWNFCISAEAENPELLVKLIDNEYASAVMDQYNWGEEGVHYTVGENGQKQLIAKSAMEYEQLLEEHPRMPALRWNQDRGSQMAEKSLLEPVSTVFDGVYETMDYWTFSTRYIRADNALPNDSALARLARSSLTDEQSNTVSQDLRGVQNVILQNIRQFITGEKDLSEWDAFIEQAKQSGDYQSVLNVYNDQLDWLRTLSR